MSLFVDQRYWYQELETYGMSMTALRTTFAGAANSVANVSLFLWEVCLFIFACYLSSILFTISCGQMALICGSFFFILLSFDGYNFLERNSKAAQFWFLSNCCLLWFSLNTLLGFIPYISFAPYLLIFIGLIAYFGLIIGRLLFLSLPDKAYDLDANADLNCIFLGISKAQDKRLHQHEILMRRIILPEGDAEYKVVPPNKRPIYNILAHVINFSIALIGLFITAPLWLIIAIVIKIDDNGPIFFLQQRVGYLGTKFIIYKFRTMTAGNKLTRVGKILRKLRLDELPQFINILLRQVNIVGPRPFTLAESDHFAIMIPSFTYRYCVLPGITGLAQVSHRYDNSLPDARVKLSYDLFYVKNQSLILDALICLWSIATILLVKGK